MSGRGLYVITRVYMFAFWARGLRTNVRQSVPSFCTANTLILDYTQITHSSPVYLLRGDTVVEAKVTLKVVRTGVKRVLMYSKVENATFCSFPWTQTVNFISKGTIFHSYVLNSLVDYRLPCAPLSGQSVFDILYAQGAGDRE